MPAYTFHQMEAMSQGRPMPRNTLTELEPVTFPIAESASGDDLAAVMEAKVSGREVPIATRVIPVTEGFRLITQPSTVATSPMIVVTAPIRSRATKKAAHPPHIFRGGMIAPKTFQ